MPAVLADTGPPGAPSWASAGTVGAAAQIVVVWPEHCQHCAVARNAAKRAVRPVVLRRKQRLGSKGDFGNQFVIRILSVAITCQQQRRSLLDYLTAVCSAQHRGQAIPSLLPAWP